MKKIITLVIISCVSCFSYIQAQEFTEKSVVYLKKMVPLGFDVSTEYDTLERNAIVPNPPIEIYFGCGFATVKSRIIYSLPSSHCSYVAVRVPGVSSKYQNRKQLRET